MRVRDPARVERIIETAAQLFGEFGYNDVRMEDIANRAGMAKGTLYLYFKDKDDLFLALILERMKHLFDRARVLAADDVSPETRLVNVVRDAFDYFRRQPYIFAAIQRLDNTGTASQIQALRASRDRFLNLTAGIITQLIPPGQKTATTAEMSAKLLCGMMRELLFAPTADFDEAPEQIVHVLLHGILNGGGPAR